MSEVSSCIINKKIKPGHKVKKGDELGYFQFGGSTHCLVFQKGVIDKFDVEIGQDVKMGSLITKG
jgi:phosphatidylserine decarboxylase